MGNGGEDVILYDSTGLKDRNLTGGTNAPNVDASQDWTESSNTVTSGVRTIVATRALDTTEILKIMCFQLQLQVFRCFGQWATIPLF